VQHPLHVVRNANACNPIQLRLCAMMCGGAAPVCGGACGGVCAMMCGGARAVVRVQW
jgi:hypothetical protein